MNNIKVLMRVTPSYGETLIVIGGIMLTIGDSVIENDNVRKELGEYLNSDKCQYGKALLPMDSPVWDVLDKYVSGKRPVIAAVRNNGKIGNDIPVQLELIDFFKDKMLPMLIWCYINEIEYDKEYVSFDVEIMADVYKKFYSIVESEEKISKVFFQEIKELLLYNYMVIREAMIDSDENVKLKLLIPIPHIFKL